MKLAVVKCDDGSYEVLDGHLTTGKLSFGEMLETVIRVMNPEMPGPRYPMKTESEWEAAFNRHNRTGAK